MNTDPGLPRRFATRLALRDYSPTELALIAEKVARERFELEFAEGLLEDLAVHILQVHGHETQLHNGPPLPLFRSARKSAKIEEGRGVFRALGIFTDPSSRPF